MVDGVGHGTVLGVARGRSRGPRRPGELGLLLLLLVVVLVVVEAPHLPVEHDGGLGAGHGGGALHQQEWGEGGDESSCRLFFFLFLNILVCFFLFLNILVCKSNFFWIIQLPFTTTAPNWIID